MYITENENFYRKNYVRIQFKPSCRKISACQGTLGERIASAQRKIAPKPLSSPLVSSINNLLFHDSSEGSVLNLPISATHASSSTPVNEQRLFPVTFRSPEKIEKTSEVTPFPQKRIVRPNEPQNTTVSSNKSLFDPRWRLSPLGKWVL